MTAALALAFLASGARATTPAEAGRDVGVLMAVEAECGEDTIFGVTREGYDLMTARFMADDEFWKAALEAMASYMAELQANPSICIVAKRAVKGYDQQ